MAGAASKLRTNADYFAGLVTLEMGKLIAQARGEVALSAAILDYYSERAEPGASCPSSASANS